MAPLVSGSQPTLLRALHIMSWISNKYTQVAINSPSKYGVERS